MKKKIILYTDGGARGNPGPAAIGVIWGEKGWSEYIGEATNNVAEYKAVVFALSKLKNALHGEELKNIELEIRSDSELLVQQMNHKYKIKEMELKMLFVDVWNASIEFGSVSFLHIPREKNREADALVNKELDRRMF